MDGPVAHPMTVAAALTLPAIRRGLPEVVAGAGALDRPIRWVHAGEVPNIASLLRGGELLLTTGMGIGSRGAEQRLFIAELATCGVSALVIELGGAFKERLPSALVAAAELQQLPLIELHSAVPFVAITEAIHTEIVNSDHEVLQRADDLHERFTTLMIEGGGVPEVLSLLAEAVGNPVFLEGSDGRLLFSAAPSARSTPGDPVETWAQAAGAAALGASAPVPAGDRQTAGRLVTLPLDEPLGAFAEVAVERAAGIIALAFLRSRQEDEVVALGRGDLLCRLADGRLNADAAAARAHAMGFSGGEGAALLPVVAKLRDAPAARSWRASLRELETRLAALGLSVLLGLDPSETDLLLIFVVRGPATRGDVAECAAAAIRQTVGSDEATVVVAVGGTGGWHALAGGLRDATEAGAAAVHLPHRPWHDASAMPLDRLLWRLRNEADLHGYVARVLGPVIEHDEHRKHALLPTLEALCAQGGRRAEAARALHLNRQALYDRIARLETLLEKDLSDPRTLLAFQIATEARHHIDPASAGRPD